MITSGGAFETKSALFSLPSSRWDSLSVSVICFTEAVERFVEIHVTLNGHAYCDAARNEPEHIRGWPLGGGSEHSLHSSEMREILFQSTQCCPGWRLFMSHERRVPLAPADS